MKTEMLSTRIDQDTKLAFTQVCDQLGLSTSQALKLFAKAVINHGGIPFELKTKVPSTETAQAIAELETGSGTAVQSIEELFSELPVSKLK